ncbi:MAG: shikimate dehydrogenase [Actinobacteria bacterium]|nr:shikimate dehydrogenase [Actinomycetota bacterium]
MSPRAAVLGHPIEHSLSPVMHRAAYAALALDWRYDAIDVTSEQLPGFIAALDDSWRGLSLTMPLKQDILPLLDESDDWVATVSAANTVVLRGGRLLGHNTDVEGIVQAVREVAAEPRSAAVIGGGATARSTVAALAELGAVSVTLTARREQPARELQDLATRLGLCARCVAWQDRYTVLDADLVVCTLPGDAASDFAQAVPADPGTLLDVTYAPWPTTLAGRWQERGGAVVPGYRMLLWQAVAQVALMTGLEPPVAAMATALETALAARSI